MSADRAEQAARWLADAAGRPGDTVWEAVREIAVQRSERSIAVDEASQWSRVALQAIDRGVACAQVEPDFGQRQAMAVRARLIARFGPALAGDVRDTAVIVRWFTAEVADLELPASRLDLAALSLDAIRALRSVKNDLVAIEPLLSQPQFPATPGAAVVFAWAERRDFLP